MLLPVRNPIRSQGERIERKREKNATERTEVKNDKERREDCADMS